MFNFIVSFRVILLLFLFKSLCLVPVPSRLPDRKHQILFREGTVRHADPSQCDAKHDGEGRQMPPILQFLQPAAEDVEIPKQGGQTVI